MLRQKNIIKKEDVKGELKKAIGYDGKIMEGVFVSSMGQVLKEVDECNFEICYSYLNKPGKGNEWKKGYYKVRINDNLYNLHWLIARAFVPGYELGLCVDHINNDSTDNRIENLQWITRSENTKKFWKNLTPEELVAYKQKYSKGVKAGHDSGKYKEHLKLLHNKGD